MKPVISIDGVTKRFGRQEALAKASFDVPPGVVFALLGENGAGKTTAIRIMLGLTNADAGTARVLGLDSRRHGLEIRRRVGYVPERPTLYDWMTVREIGWFTAGFFGDGFDEGYIRLTEQFGLPRHRKLRQLSKGMAAKVALALAMAHRPELLVLDEPTSGLDTMVRREFLESMVDVAAAGRTVLLSSHQIGEVERVADIVAIIRAGRVLLVERLDELKQQMQELTITVAEGAPPPPVLAGELMRQCHRRQCQVLLRGLTEAQLDALRAADGTESVAARTPALEEIFVAYMRSNLGHNDRPAEAVPDPQSTAQSATKPSTGDGP